jgi:hypothetical protein
VSWSGGDSLRARLSQNAIPDGDGTSKILDGSANALEYRDLTGETVTSLTPI